MKTLLTVLVAFALSTFAQAASRDGWLDNFETARAQAAKQNRKILLDFTGSDWCPFCRQLNNEVFSKTEFKDYASKKLVLMEVDFPTRTKLPEAVRNQNEALKAKYRIEGFPQIVILNSAGKKVGQFGFVEGGPKAMIAAIEKTKK